MRNLLELISTTLNSLTKLSISVNHCPKKRKLKIRKLLKNKEKKKKERRKTQKMKNQKMQKIQKKVNKIFRPRLIIYGKAMPRPNGEKIYISSINNNIKKFLKN